MILKHFIIRIGSNFLCSPEYRTKKLLSPWSSVLRSCPLRQHADNMWLLPFIAFFLIHVSRPKNLNSHYMTTFYFQIYIHLCWDRLGWILCFQIYIKSEHTKCNVLCVIVRFMKLFLNLKDIMAHMKYGSNNISIKINNLFTRSRRLNLVGYINWPFCKKIVTPERNSAIENISFRKWQFLFL